VWYAIAAAVLSIVGGLLWRRISNRKAGKAIEQSKQLKAGAEARERQDAEFEKVRGKLASRIAGKLQDLDRRET
jgi:hypothetical protein